MDRIDLQKTSINEVAEKLNQVIDIMNFYSDFFSKEQELKINLLQYGKYLMNAEVIEDLKKRILECE